MKIRLGEVCRFVNGGTPSKDIDRFYQGDIPWITSADIVNSKVSVARSFITPEALANSATNLVPKGAVLLVTRTGVGKVAVAECDLCFSQDITAIVPDKERLSVGYLIHFLGTQRSYFDRLARGATIKGITRDVVADLEIPLPSLSEQRRIAAILDKADTLRAQRREALAQLDQLAQAIFVEMFGNPVNNEKNWPTKRVDELCELVRGSSPRPQGDPKYFGGSVPRLMIADITRDGWLVTPRIDSLTVEGAKYSRPIKSGTVVMAVSGNIGLVSILAIDACIHDGFVAFKNLNAEQCNPVYLLTLMHLSKAVHEKSKAGAIFINLTTADIKAMRLPVPSISLQEEFARRLGKLNDMKVSQEESVVEVDALFSSLQFRAFRGEL